MSDQTRKWNPRYTAYARAHGRDEEGMLGHDRERWLGGCMAGFLLWMSARWREWRRLRGRRERDELWDSDYADFDAWLGARSA